MQQEILPRISVEVGYFRRIWNNFSVTDNVLASASDYTLFNMVVPTDARLPGGGGYTVTGVTNINPATFGQTQNFNTLSSKYGKQTDHWNGVDITLNGRLQNGLSFQAGISTGREATNNCAVVAQVPEAAARCRQQFCSVTEPFLTQFKGYGSYTIPHVDVQVAATFRSMPGMTNGGNGGRGLGPGGELRGRQRVSGGELDPGSGAVGRREERHGADRQPRRALSGSGQRARPPLRQGVPLRPDAVDAQPRPLQRAERQHGADGQQLIRELAAADVDHQRAPAEGQLHVRPPVAFHPQELRAGFPPSAPAVSFPVSPSIPSASGRAAVTSSSQSGPWYPSGCPSGPSGACPAPSPRSKARAFTCAVRLDSAKPPRSIRSCCSTTFEATYPEEYLAGFPWHPHRGIETITYVLAGTVEHGDSLGNRGAIGAGDVQWMTAGSGIIHQEMPTGDPAGRMHGFQLWANLPASLKMTPPRYQEVKAGDIPEAVDDDGTRARVICGRLWGVSGPVDGVAAEPTYLDISIPPGRAKTLPVETTRHAFAYVFAGAGMFGNASDPRPVRTDGVAEAGAVAPQAGNRSLVLFDRGDEISIQAGDEGVRFLLVSGTPIEEPVAWYGPIVMNTQEQLRQAFDELQRGTFLADRA